MSLKPITVQGTFCDAEGCDKQVVKGGQRHCVVSTDFAVGIFKKKTKEMFFVKAAAVGDYCGLSCLLDAIKREVGEAQREDEKLPFPEGKGNA